MRWVIGVALFGLALCSEANPPAKPKASNPSKAQVSNSSIKAGSTKRTTRKRRSASGPNYQAHPDPERYQQIQQALADRGYFKGEVNGQWGDDSVDALKRFQADKKLMDDGKISSLTLIGLGLGPKHDGSAVTSPVASAVSVPPPPVSAPEGTAPPQ